MQPDVAEKVVQEPTEPRETRNVFYRGIVRPAGISIYMEGSHKLELEEGRFILLESEEIDLNGYVGESVESFGSIRPTVEAGAMIMRVERMRLVGEDGETPVEEEPNESGDQVVVSDDTPETDDTEQEGTSRSERAAQEDAEASQESSEETPETSSSSNEGDQASLSSEQEESSSASSQSSVEEETETASADPTFQERVDTMASHDISPGRWTQRYCTEHIGFCAPVLDYWYFISFGATTSSLWHVEYSSDPIDDHRIGDGPIQIKLYSGTVSMKKAVDKQVKVSNGKATGYREWTEGRHFEVTAPAALQAAVQYIVENMEEYTEEE